MAYGARLESELGATPRGFKSRILRSDLLTDAVTYRPSGISLKPPSLIT